MDTIKKGITSKTFGVILRILGVLIIALIIFQAGVFIGERKADFSGGLGEEYHQIFGSRMMGDLSGAHGAVGKVVSISLPNVIIAGRDNIEKTIVITDDTKILKLREEISPADMHVNDTVVVLGSPTASSSIDATLIRIIP